MAMDFQGDFWGYEQRLRTLSGAHAVRVSHAPDRTIGAHDHDWPHLTIHLLGDCTEEYDGATVVLDRPAAIFHPASSHHRNAVGADGLETFGIVFDPDWLREPALRKALDRPVSWRGSAVGARARALAAAWQDGSWGEGRLKAATVDFFRAALDSKRPPDPPWLATVTAALRRPSPPSTAELSEALQLHPAWLARAYRAATGEGIRETILRRRVQCAHALILRRTSSISDVAMAAGFSDQSHMTRSFQALLGASPGAILKVATVRSAGRA